MLKHRNIVPTVERVVEVTDGERLERLEIECLSRRRQSVKIIVWEDRSIWFHACESIKNAGWKFQFTDRGRFLGGEDGRELVEALEASLSVMFEMTADTVDRLAAIWAARIAKGPRANP